MLGLASAEQVGKISNVVENSGLKFLQGIDPFTITGVQRGNKGHPRCKTYEMAPLSKCRQTVVALQPQPECLRGGQI